MHKQFSHKDGTTWLHKIIIFTSKSVIIPRKMLSQYFTAAHKVKLNIIMSSDVGQHTTCSGQKILRIAANNAEKSTTGRHFIQNAVISVNLPASGLLLNLTCAVHSSSPHSSASDIPHAHCINCRGNAQQSLQADTRVNRARKHVQNQVCLRGQEARSAIELIRHCAVRMNNDRYSASRPSSPRRCALTNFRQRCTTR